MADFIFGTILRFLAELLWDVLWHTVWEILSSGVRWLWRALRGR